MAGSTQGRNSAFVAALLAIALLRAVPASAQDSDAASPIGPQTIQLSPADSDAMQVQVPAQIQALRSELSRSQRFWRAGRSLEAQIAAERLLQELHDLRQSSPVSFAQNQDIIDLIQQAGGMRLKCVRQHLAVRPSFGEKASAAEDDTAADIADVPLSQASLPTDSLLASADAQEIQPESNDRVQKWIDFFTGRGRRTFSAWLQRSGSYMDMMVPVLERNGMPVDLIHLVFVESGFNPKALSSSAASGPWQFVRGTAQIFGLNVDAKFDERRDPARSTEAAAQYLKHLYSLFHDWPLALAAYNSGEGTVLRALKSQNTFDYWSLHLPRQTEDYVPEFMAALTIARDPAAFGFEGKVNPPLSFDQIVVPGGLNLRVLSYLTAAPLEELKSLNPAILRRQAPRTAGGVLVRVPRGTGAECVDRLKAKDYPSALAAPEREPRRASAHAARHGRKVHGSKAAAARRRAHSSSPSGKRASHGAKSAHGKSVHAKSASTHSAGHHKKPRTSAHKSKTHHH